MASFIYRLEEMSDEMAQSLNHVKTINTEQEALCTLVEDSESAERFVEFTKDLRKSIDDQRKQVTTLELRKTMLDAVVEYCHTNEDVANVVSNLLCALGVVELTDSTK